MSDLGFMCLIALDDADPVPLRQVERAFATLSPRSRIGLRPLSVPGCAQAFHASVDGIGFAGAVFNSRIPEPEYSAATAQSLFWRGAGEAMSGHRAFLALSGGERQGTHGLARAQAVALTKLAAAAAEAGNSLGVYWRGAEAAVPPGRLVEATAEIAAGKWPVDVWLGFAFFGDDARDPPHLGLQTRGASDYLGFELEIAPFQVRSRMEPVRIVFNAIAYLMNYGDVIRDGQLVEVGGERRTAYQILLGRPDQPGVARLSVLDTEQRKIN